MYGLVGKQGMLCALLMHMPMTAGLAGRVLLAERVSTDVVGVRCARPVQGFTKVAVVAHSMGNRALTRCLHEQSELCLSLLQRIVFVAPDVTREDFRNRTRHFLQHARSDQRAAPPLLALYRNSRDQVLHAYHRWRPVAQLFSELYARLHRCRVRHCCRP